MGQVRAVFGKVGLDTEGASDVPVFIVDDDVSYVVLDSAGAAGAEVTTVPQIGDNRYTAVELDADNANETITYKDLKGNTKLVRIMAGDERSKIHFVPAGWTITVS